MMYLLIINTILLVSATIALGYKAAARTKISKIILSQFDLINERYYEKNLKKQVKQYRRNISGKMDAIEKVELYLIGRSNIKKYISFMNFYVLIFISIIIFAVVFNPVNKILRFIPSTIVICFLISMIPFFILDLMGRYNSEKIRKKLAGFISILSRWCTVKEDIFYAFEKSIDSGLGEPLNTFIKETVIQVNRGIQPSEALDILQMKVDNSQFKDFILNIKKSIEHRGDIVKLLTNLENQFYKIEEEYNRRKISTYKDRVMIYLIMFGVLITAYFFIKLNPDVEAFYLETVEGKLLLTLFSMLYATGFAITTGISKFNY
jgi:Flp pilus assembly protein TadB